MLPFGFEVTAFLAEPGSGVFFLGSRQGALACYELITAKLVGIWRRIHDQEGVRSVRLHRYIETPTPCIEIMTTGRNGVYQIMRILVPEEFIGEMQPDVVDGSLDGVVMQFFHRCNLNQGWLEGVL